MTFVDFARTLGLIIDTTPPAGVWRRYPTTDHPRSKNGAAKWMGDIGWVQNHATMVQPATWRADAAAPAVDMAEVNRQAQAHHEQQRRRWVRAAAGAVDLLKSCRVQEHNYLHIKGHGDQRGLVLPDGALLVPMRHWRTNALAGAQVIRWIDAETRYDKRMLPGMRAKGAVLRLGSPTAARLWLVEGYATGLSVEAAIGLLRLRDAVVVCFSAGNLMHVAERLQGSVVFADNDASGAGERAARATGRPWVMSPVVGEDANDMHKRAGVFRVAQMVMTLQRERTG
jgi:putative DNA primase/helicase